MAVILNWKNTIKESKERFIVSFFSFLSSKWYSRNVINSPDAGYLDAYDFIDIYSEEFYLNNQEIIKIFNDLSIDTVRTANVALRGFSKLYDNFGADLLAPKHSYQFFDAYNFDEYLQTYRQELRFLTTAYDKGTTLEALKDIGYAFTGISPIIKDPLYQYDGWVLTSYTGSVIDVGNDFIITDFNVPNVGNLFNIDTDTFAKNIPISYSFSKLGTNTKLKSKVKYNSENELIFFTKNTSSVVKNLINFHSQKVSRADIQHLISYSDNCVIYRPIGNSGLDQITFVSDDIAASSSFLYNKKRLFPTGSILTTPVISLPDSYQSYDWFYDWLINSRNSGNYKMEIRSYPLSIIPDSVPYDLYSQDLPLLLFNGDVNTPHAHWKFNHTSSLFDISGNGFNLPLQTSSQFQVARSRNEYQWCFTNLNDYNYQSYVTALDPEKPLRYELWVKGLDTTLPTSSKFEIASIKDSSNYNKFYIDSSSKRFGIEINNSGNIQDAFVDISDIFEEVAERYHYLGISYIPIETEYSELSYFGSAIMGTSLFSTIATSSVLTGKILFYLDGNLIDSQELTVKPPNLNDGDAIPPVLSVNTTGSGFTIDEILMSEGFLNENDAKNNYERSRPRLHRQGLPSSSVHKYHQAKITFYAYDANEIEFHQFSIRGIQSPIYKTRGKRYATIFTHPIFHLS